MRKLLSISLILLSGFAQAATINWSNQSGGDYTNGANWTGGVAPGINDRGQFNISNLVATLSASITNNAIGFEYRKGTNTINLGGYTLTLTNGYVAYYQALGLSWPQTNSVVFSNGTLAIPNATVTDFGTGYASVTNGTIATCTMINMNFFAKEWGVCAVDGSYCGTVYWNFLNSTGNIATLAIANSGGASTPGTGVVTVANGSFLTVSNNIGIGQVGDLSGMNGTINISNATMNALGNITLGNNGGYGPVNGHLNIVNGGQLIMATNAGVALSAGGTPSTYGAYGSIFMDGSNSSITCLQGGSGGGILLNGVGGWTSTMVVANGTINLSNGYFTACSAAGSKGTYLQTGGTVNEYGGARTYLSGNAANQWSTFWLAGTNNPQFNAQDYTYLASGGTNCYAELGVSNGTFRTTGRIVLANTPGTVAHMYALNGGQIIQGGSGLTVGSAGATGTVLVTDGGLLECGSSGNNVTCGAQAQNTIYILSNGIWQFPYYSPSITPGIYGNIAVSNATISFRAINNADVLCNQSGKALDSTNKVAFYGNNTFMLNAATNATTGQAYTFSTAYGATNWAGLILTNNAMWRGGDIVITNGTLAGAGVISNNVTMQSGSTVNANTNGQYFLCASNITLGGTCTLPNGYTPSGSGVIVFSNTVGTISGNFSSVPAGVSAQVNAHSVVLTAASATTPYNYALWQLMLLQK